jgi:hypothetical protein
VSSIKTNIYLLKSNNAAFTFDVKRKNKNCIAAIPIAMFNAADIANEYTNIKKNLAHLLTFKTSSLTSSVLISIFSFLYV